MTIAAPKIPIGPAAEFDLRRTENLISNRNFFHGHMLQCINDQGFKRTYIPGPPIKNHVYWVREIYEDRGELGVLLVGIIGPFSPSGLEQGFLLSRFRWVIE
jgi:hypothetical protein